LVKVPPLGATGHHQPKKIQPMYHIHMLPSALLFVISDFVSSNEPFVCPVWTDIFHVWALQGYTGGGWVSNAQEHWLLLTYGYTPDDEIMNVVFSHVSNKFALLPPINSRTFFRHWAPLDAPSHKWTPHRWSLPPPQPEPPIGACPWGQRSLNPLVSVNEDIN
jgi:hypothetical protein